MHRSENPIRLFKGTGGSSIKLLALSLSRTGEWVPRCVGKWRALLAFMVSSTALRQTHMIGHVLVPGCCCSWPFTIFALRPFKVDYELGDRSDPDKARLHHIHSGDGEIRMFGKCRSIISRMYTIKFEWGYRIRALLFQSIFIHPRSPPSFFSGMSYKSQR